jgi:coatomer subunit beta
MSGHDSVCTILMAPPAPAPPAEQGLIDKSPFGLKPDPATMTVQQRLESEDPLIKADALRELILNIVNGQPQPRMLMPVLKFCLNTKDHNLKKLLLIFWEVVDKTTADGPNKGKLLPEMILVCNALRNDLQHPNEYIRGITLKFLCKIKHIPELLGPLIPALLECLKHRHSYVRKNAVLTVFEIFTSETSKDLIPDAPQLIDDFLTEESNISAKRNAFLALFNCDQSRAIRYLATVIDQLSSMGESFQMVFLEVVRKVLAKGSNSNQLVSRARPFYLRAVFSLLNSSSNTVSFEAANTLLSLSSAPSAVRAAVQTLCQLLVVDSDNNVKLIILNKLENLKVRHERVLQEKLMDLLRVLSTPDIDIRRKALKSALQLLSAQNIEDVVSYLKKEIVKVDNSNDQSAAEYKKALVQSIYECAVKFPHVASSVVHLLIGFVGDERSDFALDVLLFVREIIQEFPNLRSQILHKLIESFAEIKSSVVFHAALWILGEFARDPEILPKAFEVIRSSIGTLPLVEVTEKKADVKETKAESHSTHKIVSRPVVLADGTYAQQSAYESVDHGEKSSEVEGLEQLTLRTLLLRGDFYLGAAIANSLTKLALAFSNTVGNKNPVAVNKQVAYSLLYLTAILKLGTSFTGETPGVASKKIDEDSYKRIAQCIETLLNYKDAKLSSIFLERCRETFAHMIVERRKENEARLKLKSSSSKKKGVSESFEIHQQPDDLINLRQLKGRQGHEGADMFFDDDLDTDLTRAYLGDNKKSDDFASRLERIVQLTGYSDAIYAEACVTVHEYDIVLDILLINQCDETLQNVSVELNTSGDLKLVERPQGYTIAPYGFKNVEANIKVSSTESGVIFGSIVYDTTGSTKEKNIIVMSSIHMDISDYISKAQLAQHFCSESDFRKMWSEFEWENKVTVNTEISDLTKYIDHLVSITCMNCLTRAGGEYSDTGKGTVGFLAANLYTKSIFGEDALLNVSIEKTVEGKIAGHIRIRSKTQGIALSLGDKITSKQRFIAE